MLRETYHPNAYLAKVRNVCLGLRARTRILKSLERGSGDAGAIARGVGLHYGVVMHHLRLLQSEKLVMRGRGRPSVWTLTGSGQRRLMDTS